MDSMSLLQHVNDFKYSRDLPFSQPNSPWIGIAIYLLLILALRTWMKTRNEGYKLLTFARIHNVVLCLCSGIMLIGTVYHLSYHVLTKQRSLKYLVTDPNLEIYDSLQFWFYLYYLSKYYELIDTFILILKKKPLIVLHVWHHGIMLFLAWIWTDSKWTLVWYGMSFNTFIHVIMYYYYFVATFGKKPWWRQYLTQLQLLQFFTVFIWIFYWLYVCPNIENGDWKNYDWIYGDVSCSGNYTKPWVVVLSQGVNITFLALFGNFFYQQYAKKSTKKTKKEQ
mmetsp:Transcript_42065/g.67633  ORF Transcript_42065/g.67633 Transcript_42065/m.67633 type:complete len:280 (-) Transcript_42065:40-879(-)